MKGQQHIDTGTRSMTKKNDHNNHDQGGAVEVLLVYEDEYLEDENFLVTRPGRHESANQRRHNDNGEEEDHHIEGSNSNYDSSLLVDIPDRIIYLHQQLKRLKIATEDSARHLISISVEDKNDRRGQNPSTYATQRQLALDEKGVSMTTVRQRGRVAGSTISSQNRQRCEKATKINRLRHQKSIKRQRALYTLGVKKLRYRNQQEESRATQKVAAGEDSAYYKVLYQRLHTLVADIDNMVNISSSVTVPASSTISTTEESCGSRGSETDLKAILSGIDSMPNFDFPELQDLEKIHTGTIACGFLQRQQMTARNISKFCLKSQKLLRGDQERSASEVTTDALSCLKTYLGKEGHAAAVHMTTDEYAALKLGLCGIVHQYLEDIVDDVQRSKKLAISNVSSESINESESTVIVNRNDLLKTRRSQVSDATRGAETALRHQLTADLTKSESMSSDDLQIHNKSDHSSRTLQMMRIESDSVVEPGEDQSSLVQEESEHGTIRRSDTSMSSSYHHSSNYWRNGIKQSDGRRLCIENWDDTNGNVVMASGKCGIDTKTIMDVTDGDSCRFVVRKKTNEIGEIELYINNYY